jgi:GT2 family glycosyltransferase
VKGSGVGSKVSVVIPVYNSAHVIAHQLEALAQQDGIDDAEVIVADNGCTDQTLAVVARYASSFRCLRVVDASARRGAPAAANQGIEATHGEVILLCNDDDQVQPGWLTTLLDHCHDRLAVGAWVPTADGVSLSEKVVPSAQAPFLPYGINANIGFPRRLWEELGGFDETLPAGEDVDFCWRSQLSGFPFAVVPEAVIHKRLRGDTHSAWRQHFTYGFSEPLLYRNFRNLGMRRNLATSARRYAWLLSRAPMLCRSSVRTVWIRLAADCAGRVRGSIRFRVFYP